MALFSWSNHPKYPATLDASPDSGLPRFQGAPGAFILALSVLLVVTLTGCAGNITRAARGWSVVTAGELTGEDDIARTVLYVGTVEGEVLAIDPEAIQEAPFNPTEIALAQNQIIDVVGGSVIEGALLWRFKPVTESERREIFGPAAVGEELVYFAVSDTGRDETILYALRKDRDPSRGAGLDTEQDREWRHLIEGLPQPIEGAVVGGPALTAAQDMVLVGSDEGFFYAFDAATGELKWRFPQGPEPIGEIWSTPAVDEERVYFGSLDHKVYALSLENGTLEWAFETGGAVVGRPLVVEGNVIIGSFDRQLYLIEAETGLERSVIKADNWFWAGAVTDGILVFVPSIDGEVHVLDQAGNPMGSLSLEEGPVVSRPWLLKADGGTFVVVANEDGDLHLIPNSPPPVQRSGDGATATVARRVVGDKVKSPLGGAGDALFVGNTDGTVSAMQFQDPASLKELWRMDTEE